MERGKRVIGVLLIAVSIAALVTWEKWGKNRFLYEEVLVLTCNVEKGTVITGEMVAVRNMDVTEEDCMRAGDRELVIGREAAFFIHRNVPLFGEYFREEGLGANAQQGKYILSVPSEWLAVLPSSLARGDRAYFFCGGSFVTSAFVSYVSREEKSLEVVVNDRQAERLSELGGQGEKMVIIYN
ncbi:MAG: hypothetical protein ACI4LA_10255 [Emergencia sp.]